MVEVAPPFGCPSAENVFFLNLLYYTAFSVALRVVIAIC